MREDRRQGGRLSRAHSMVNGHSPSGADRRAATAPRDRRHSSQAAPNRQDCLFSRDGLDGCQRRRPRRQAEEGDWSFRSPSRSAWRFYSIFYGLYGVTLVNSDANEGTNPATSLVLFTACQPCRIHFQRNPLAPARPDSRRVSWPSSSVLLRSQTILAPDPVADGGKPDKAQTAEARQSSSTGRQNQSPHSGRRHLIRRGFDLETWEADLMEQTKESAVHRDRCMTPETLAAICVDSMVSLPAARVD